MSAITNAANFSKIPALVTERGVGQPFYVPIDISGGGGGGGSVGPNPSVSTITINPAGAVVLTNNGAGGSANILGYTQNSATPTSTTTFSIAFPSGYIGANGLTGIWTIESQDNLSSSYYGDLCAGKFVVAGNNSGTNAELPWITAGVASDMTIHAASSINLQTSSVLVNGTPLSGGSIPANLIVSTITGQDGIADSDANSVLRQASDGSGRTQLAYNISDRIGFGTYPVLCPTAPTGVQMGYLACALDSNANPAGFAIGGDPNTTAQGALVFNDSTGNNNDDWIIGGGGNMTHYAKATINFSTLVVDVPTTLSSQNLLVSSINGAPVGGAAGPNLTLSSLTTSSIVAGVDSNVSVVGNSMTIANGANPLVLYSDNAANARVYASGAGGLALSTIASVNSSGPPMFYGATPYGNPRGEGIQFGYAQDVPSGSTILFNVPYTTENVGVILTPTNRNTTGGANPNCSLNNGYGLNGNGVSSIGFAVDLRDGGVGYNGSFMWMAMPRNIT